MTAAASHPLDPGTFDIVGARATLLPRADELTRPELSCRVLKPALLYLERLYGREELARIIADTGLELSYVSNENNWISFAYHERLLHAITKRTGNPDAVFDSGRFAATKEAYGSLYYALLAFGRPALVYRKFVEVGGLISKVGTFRLEEVGSGRARIRYRVNPPFAQTELNCASIRGQLSSIPTVWSLPSATVIEPVCQAHGGDACIYEIQWVERPHIQSGLIGGILGLICGLVAHALFLGIGTPLTAQLVFNYGVLVAFGFFVGRAIDTQRALTREAEANQGRASALLSSLGELEERYEEVRAAHDEIREKARQLAAFNRLGTQLNRTLDLENVFETILRVAVEELGFERAALFLVDEERGTLGFKSGVNVPSAVSLRLRQIEIPMDSGGALSRSCVAGALATGLGDGRSGGGLELEMELAALVGDRPWVVAPLKNEREVIGTLVLAGADPFGSLSSEEAFLSVLGNQMTNAVENSFAFEVAEGILESLPLAVAIVDRAERIEYANQAFTRLFSGAARGAAGLTFCDLVDCGEEQRKKLRQQVHGVRRRRGSREGEVRVGGRVIEYRLFLLTRTAGTRRRVGVIIKDVTEERDLQQRLGQAEKLAGIGTLASGVAHEINNPLAAILAHAEAVEDEQDLGAVRDHATKIANYAVMASNIVRELSVYSRKAKEEASGPVDVNEAIEAALGLARHGGDFGKVEVSLELSGDLPPLQGSRVELTQVFVNLILNAAQAMSFHGHLRVTSALTPRGVEVVIDDTGPGVPEDMRARLFEPFFTTKETGTGLGLYIVYKIVSKHQGSVTVDRSPEGGARFTLRFPAGGRS